MDERYGAAASQDVTDVDWIREASMRGECLLTKDVAIARNPSEAEVVYLCNGPDMLARLLLHEAAVFRWTRRAAAPGRAG